MTALRKRVKAPCAADLVEESPSGLKDDGVVHGWEVGVLADLNFVALTGFSTREPALRQKSSGQIKAEFSFEVDRPFLRANGEPVSDLFLVDAWQEMGEWVMENVSSGTRLMIVGTLNKESYNSHGSREHMTIVKAKYIRKTSGQLSDTAGALDGLKGDSWSSELLLDACEIIKEAIRDSDAPATLDSPKVADKS